MTIQEKAENLMQLRAKIAEVEEQFKSILEPLKAEKDSMEQGLMDSLKRNGFDSVKTQKATITIAHRKTVIVSDENALITELKAKGLNEYVKEALNKELFKGVSDQIKKTGETMPGITLQDTEYMAVREKKEKVNK